MEAGVAIKPKTSVDELLEVMRKCNSLKTRVQNALVMTVEPGFGGQKFMGDMMPKVEAIRREFTGLLKNSFIQPESLKFNRLKIILEVITYH